KVEMSMDAHSLGSATWDGTWKQNKNCTVTVTFSSAGESAIKINNNDPEAPEHPGMGSLTVTSVISGETHKLTVPLTLDVGGGWMFDLTAEFALQEVVEA
ncbi:MAG: hypothetical protein K2K12_04860, partial [Clostridia bacterium]|nr:hypothetical protein [Clostridia bacterium]